jgi:hypothetical protein
MSVNVAQHKVKLGGKEYIMVAGRILLALEDAGAHDMVIQVRSEVIHNDEKSVIMRATVTTPRGTANGHAESDKLGGRGMEKESPIEIAETSAIGRALGFLGYAIEDGIASYEEVRGAREREAAPTPIRQEAKPTMIAPAQLHTIRDLLASMDMDERQFCKTAQIRNLSELTAERASGAVVYLTKLRMSPSASDVPQGEDNLFQGEEPYPDLVKAQEASQERTGAKR